MVSLRTHNILDYVGAAVLVLAPFLFGFSDVDAARNVFLFLGFGLALYSLITRYEFSIAKIIPLGVHMTLDVISGVVLMLAPSIFNYREFLTSGQYALHFVLGVGVIGLVAVTRRKTERGTISDMGTYRGTTATDMDADRRRDRVAFP
jgi:hypothetical protein